MVSYKEVKASNGLINDTNAPRVSVFVGGTNGIGKYTIKALVGTGASVRVYMVGRKSAEERSRTFIEELHTLNPKAEVIWVEGEMSLLAEGRRVCELIKSKESRVDLLYLTAGYAPFGPRKETSEGIEVAQSLEYYSRMLFIFHLIPLLNKAEAPKVVSVLAGGLTQTAVNLDDLDLKKPGNFSGFKAQIQYAIMNTTTLERLASEYPHVSFIHSWPGIVSTGNVRRGRDPNSWISWILWLFVEPLFSLFGSSDEESGQRHLFQGTSAAFGGRGVPWTGKAAVNTFQKEADGLFLVNYKCNSAQITKVMATLREKAQDRIWDHTQQVLGPHM